MAIDSQAVSHSFILLGPAEPSRRRSTRASLPPNGRLAAVTTSLTRSASHHHTLTHGSGTPPLFPPSVSRPTPSICLPCSPRLPLCILSGLSTPLPLPCLFSPTTVTDFRKERTPAPCSLLLPAVAGCTPSVPKKLHLLARLGQLAVLSRPPTSHLAFYERPRPRAATLDHRILRCTIEKGKKG